MDKTDVNHTLEHVEHILNKIGYIPLIGTLSGLLRQMMGELQLLIGIVIFIASAIMRLGNSDPTWDDRFRQSALHMGHGVLNFIRSLFEVVPLLPLITCLPYDLAKCRILTYY